MSQASKTVERIYFTPKTVYTGTHLELVSGVEVDSYQGTDNTNSPDVILLL
jgi:hypothetical protein